MSTAEASEKRFLENIILVEKSKIGIVTYRDDVGSRFGNFGKDFNDAVSLCLGRGIAARVALEQLDPKAGLDCVDMADHRCVVDPQHLGRATDRPGARHLIGRAHFIPVFHVTHINGIHMAINRKNFLSVPYSTNYIS